MPRGGFLFSRSDSATQLGIDPASLERLAALASTGGFSTIAEEASELAARLSEGRFYLACVGQFKRGKSTLIDALLGETVLPVGVLPLTAVPIVVRYGSERVARIRTATSEWQQVEIGSIEQYVSEADNPENERGVTAVEVFMPSPLLEAGMCLVDTPGLGSVFEISSTSTTAFIPHIDAAVMVLGSDPPISAAEANLAVEIGRHVRDMIFVMNKADRVSDADLAAAKQFATRILRSRLNRSIEIYEISARQVLEEKRSARDWPFFRAALARLAQTSSRQLTYQALKRGTEQVRSQLREGIAEQQNALMRPIEESEDRVRRLSASVERMKRAIEDLGHLMAAEQQRLSQQLSARRESFLAIAQPAGQERLRQRLGGRLERGPAYRRRAMLEARNVARDLVLPWFGDQEEIVALAYARTMDRFHEMANDFLQQLETMDIPQLKHLADRSLEAGELTARSRFQFHDLLHIAEPASPFRYVIDLLMGLIGAQGPIAREACDFLVHLLETNTSRVEGDFERRLAVARRELELGIRHRLTKAGAAANSILDRARDVQAAGQDAVRAELSRLAELKSAIDQVPC
jgi:dynamin family protein